VIAVRGKHPPMRVSSNGAEPAALCALPPYLGHYQAPMPFDEIQDPEVIQVTVSIVSTVNVQAMASDASSSAAAVTRGIPCTQHT